MKRLLNVPPGEEAAFFSIVVTIALAMLFMLALWFWPELFIGDLSD
ncbi:MAG: hypothetical protein WD425_17365 [Nitrospirales bacterium]